MKCAIYIRTSTKEQNPENQLNDCKKIAKEDFDLFEDKQSAWKEHKERISFERLRVLIRQKKYSDLIVWDLDRLYRNRNNLIEFFRYCNHYKVSIHSYRQKWLEDLNEIPAPFNEMMHSLMLQIMGWLAEEESNKKSERVLASLTKRNGRTYSKNGNVWGRKPIHTNKKKIVWDLLDTGLSLRAVAKESNLSVGAVHKIKMERNIKNPPKID